MTTTHSTTGVYMHLLPAPPDQIGKRPVEGVRIFAVWADDDDEARSHDGYGNEIGKMYARTRESAAQDAHRWIAENYEIIRTVEPGALWEIAFREVTE